MFLPRYVSMLSLVLIGCGSAGAGPIIVDTDIFSDTYELATVAWPSGSSLSLPLFDPSLGTLKRVWINLAGHVEGDAGFENRSSTPETITMDLAATVKLSHPSRPVAIVQVVPLASETESVAAYDKKSDFAGASGRTYLGMSNDKAEAVWLTTPFDLTLFTATPGNTTVTLPITATGASVATGPGSITSYFDTWASATAQVMYEYETLVPEPLTAFLTGIGLLTIALFSSRRRAR